MGLFGNRSGSFAWRARVDKCVEVGSSSVWTELQWALPGWRMKGPGEEQGREQKLCLLLELQGLE